MFLLSPLARSSATAQAVGNIHSKACTLKLHIRHAATQITTNATRVIMSNIWEHTQQRATAPALTDRALARTAAAMHGCCRVSRPQPVPATGIGRIAVLVVKQNLKRSIPAATVTAMEAGNSIRPTSTGVLALVVTVVQRIMTTLRTA